MKKFISLMVVLGVVVLCLNEVQAQTNGNGKRYNRSHKVRKYSQQGKVKKSTDPVEIAQVKTEEKEIAVQKIAPAEDGKVELPKGSEEEIEGDVKSGNVVVNISSNTNATVKIGLAERGVTVVDFPFDDPVYRIHPGDENFVTVGCTLRDQDGKCGNSPTDAIILRPGKSFHSLGSEEAAATVITVQRVSGMVVSFIVVPVKNVAQNANYVVVRYNLKEVIKSRMSVGLGVNLQNGLLNLPLNTAKEENSPKEAAEFVKTSSVDAGQNLTELENTAEDNNDKSSSESELQQKLIAEMQKAAANSSALRFTKPVYGLSLARASAIARTEDTLIEVVAVRNTLGQSIRLVPDQPDLVVENKDRKESINVQRINILHTATTVESDDVLNPGQIYYFAIAYQAPILGIKQVLRISFAQREAADAPASLELSGVTR